MRQNSDSKDDYVVLINKSVNIPITGCKDLDLKIMMELNEYKIESYCKLNQYTSNLCKTKHFWIDKFNKDNLLLPSNEDNVNNWVKAYQVTTFVNRKVHRGGWWNHYIVDKNVTSNYFNVLIKKYSSEKELIDNTFMENTWFRFKYNKLETFKLCLDQSGIPLTCLNVPSNKIKEVLYELFYNNIIKGFNKDPFEW